MSYRNMDLDTPSNAEVILQAMKEDSMIDLYPEKNKEKTYSETLFETYDKYFAKADQLREHKEQINSYMESAKNEILTIGFYKTFIEPIMENFLATSHEKDVALQTVHNFVQEQTADKLLDDFKYKNQYLAELAFSTNKLLDAINEGIETKIKEGLPEEDIYEIEDGDIESYLLDLNDKIPKDVTNIITKRVQNAVDEFLDDKKKSQFEIKQIYDKAKEKLDMYNQTSQAMDVVKQSDAAGGEEFGDPELGVDASLNNKLDSQFEDEIANNPNMNQIGVKEEVLAEANAKIAQILENNYGVFDAITRILVESAHSIDSLKEAYMKDNKIDTKKIFGDARAMYTCLETYNTLGVIEADEEYISKILKEMHDGIKTVQNSK